ncbi:MAG TPA: peptide ABC transporter substrate-binding protein [Candidatus Bathyarchaeia archaeon]|nr:peptide ABC transporter substrate-binding protein [Candidatus Bathyarchaeia archaeon]
MRTRLLYSRILARLGLVAGVAAVFAGCSEPAVKTLRVGNGADPQALDPHIVQGVPEHRIISTLLEGLVDTDRRTLEPVPAVASSWEISAGGTVYTFHLRPEARWSNGDPVTAHDFVYSWRRILTPTLAADYAYMLHCLKNGKAFNEGKLDDFSWVGAKALDDRTLEVTLEAPNPSFLSMQTYTAWYPVHQPTVEAFGRLDQRDNRWTRPGNFVGNGAFVLERWVPNNVIEVVKNDLYWNAGSVRLPRIQFYPIDNLLTEERSFRTGQLHLTETIPLTKVPVYVRERPDLIRIDPYLGTYFYRINVTRAPFTDVRVRRAFALALDREAIADRVMTGGQKPARTFCVPEAVGYACPVGIDYDVDEARRLLVEAGYPDGKGLPPIEILFNTNEAHKTIAEAVQRMWKENLDADVTLANQDWKVYLASQNTLNYQVSRASWIGDYNDPINFLDCFITDGGNNRTGWSSAEYDDLIHRASREPDPQARLELFAKAEAILLEEAPIIPIYHYTRTFLLSPDVIGWQSNILGYISFKHLDLRDSALEPRPVIRLKGRS